MHHDAKGILSYTLGVRSLDGAGPQKRGVTLQAAGNCTFSLANTGAAAPGGAAHLNYDVYRLSATVTGAGWSAQLSNALAAVKFGGSQTIPLYVRRTAGTAFPATVTLRATSESDATKTATAACTVR